VVIATGLFQRGKMPGFAAEIPVEIEQLHSEEYLNPQSLPPGAVLVVGTAQSGGQIAEELYQSGRQVYLCVGSSPRAPRRYRGRDGFEWLLMTGFLDRTPEMLPSQAARFTGNPHLSGKDGGHSLNLHKFCQEGVTLLGHLKGVRESRLALAPDLKQNLAKADQFEAEMQKKVDEYIAQNRIAAPEETLPVLTDGYSAPEIETLDLKASGISTIIWACGYSFDYSLVKLPVVDEFGFPITQRGVTQYPGLYFLGMPWLSKMKSGLLLGVGEDAAYLAEKIAAI
jgi:putative flavoprotein involved in K+ transport